MISLYKDGDHTAISTDARSEQEFIEEASELLSSLIADKVYEDDWEFQFNCWLPRMVDICCRYRRHDRVNIVERELLIAGESELYNGPPKHVLDRKTT